MASTAPAEPPPEPTNIFVRYEEGRRNRRTVDAVLLATAAVVTGAVAAVSNAAPSEDADLGDALVTLLGWGEAVWRTAVVATLIACAVLLVAVLVRRRWALARDLVVALLLLGLVGTLLGRAVGPDWFAIDDRLWSRWGFPEYRLAIAIAVATIIGPELVAPLRRWLTWLLVVSGLALLALGAALPSDVLAAVAVGLASALLVRVAFGSAAGVPATDDVRRSLGELGLEVPELRPSSRQERGSAAYVGHDARGESVHVRVLGRDAQDTQKIARRWHLLAYRDPRRSAPVGRLEQVEHEALATLMAAQAGVRVPEVLLAALDTEGEAGRYVQSVMEKLSSDARAALAGDAAADREV